MKKELKRHGVSITAVTGSVVAVLLMLQQMAATRESFIRANELQRVAYSDSLKIARMVIKEKDRKLQRCLRKHPSRKAEVMAEPERKGTLLVSIGHGVHWLMGPVRWITGR